MSKSEQARQNFSARRETRIRRDKIAAQIMGAIISLGMPKGSERMVWIEDSVMFSCLATDMLIQRLEDTKKNDPPDAKTD